MTANGIDVNSYCGEWNAQKSRDMGFEFAVIRAVTFDCVPLVDRQFEANWIKAEKAGLMRWAYAWTNPRKSIREQADLYIDVMNGRETELGHMLDLEDYAGFKAWRGIMRIYREQWLEPVAEAVNDLPALYLNDTYSRSYFVKPTKTTPGDIDLITYPLVVASWGGVGPTTPWPWLPTQYGAWQCVNDKLSGFQYGLSCYEATLYVLNGELH